MSASPLVSARFLSSPLELGVVAVGFAGGQVSKVTVSVAGRHADLEVTSANKVSMLDQQRSSHPDFLDSWRQSWAITFITMATYTTTWS